MGAVLAVDGRSIAGKRANLPYLVNAGFVIRQLHGGEYDYLAGGAFRRQPRHVEAQRALSELSRSGVALNGRRVCGH